MSLLQISLLIGSCWLLGITCALLFIRGACRKPSFEQAYEARKKARTSEVIL